MHDEWVMVLKNGKWGWVDHSGKVIIPCRYDAATPVKVPFWVGLLVSCPTAWATDWQRRQTQQEAERAAFGRISPAYATATDLVLGNVGNLPPGSERAKAVADGVRLLDHAAGRVVAETFLQVRNNAPVSMPSDFPTEPTDGTTDDDIEFNSAPTRLEPELDFEEVLQSWEDQFPDAPIGAETPTSSFDEVLQDHF